MLAATLASTSWTILAVVRAAAAVLPRVANWAVLRALVRFEVYDRPNARSSHEQPKPRGGGLALIPVVLLAWIAAASWLDAAPPGFWLALVAAAGLAVVSRLDDLQGLAAGPRLAVQALAVAVLLAILERRARTAA